MWKPIPEYEELYEVSNFGQIKSIKGKTRTLNHEIIMKQRIGHAGYHYVSLCKNGKRKFLKVHRLVIETFNGKSNLEVNHKDGNKSNNALNNLEYCTHKENMAHAFENHLVKTQKQVICLDNKKIFPSMRQCAKDLHISEPQLQRVCTGKKHHVHNMRFMYLDDYNKSIAT